MVALGSLGAYAALGGTLNAVKIFVSLALFDILRWPLTNLPSLLLSIVETRTAAGRLSRFLALPERRCVGPSGAGGGALLCVHACVWERALAVLRVSRGGGGVGCSSVLRV